jgi:hypothetical protein
MCDSSVKLESVQACVDRVLLHVLDQDGDNLPHVFSTANVSVGHVESSADKRTPLKQVCASIQALSGNERFPGILKP